MNPGHRQDFERDTLVPMQFVFPHSRLLSPRVRHFMGAVEGALRERLAQMT